MKVLNVILSALIIVIICGEGLLNGVGNQGLEERPHGEMSDDTVDLLSSTKRSSDRLVQRDLEVAKIRKWNDLHLAALWDLEQEVIRLIQDEDYSVNTLDSIESTPLHLAVARGNTACAQVLLGKGAKVDAPDKYGWTPLHTALFHLSSIHHPCVKLLESHHASTTTKNLQGDMPWDLRRADRSWR